MQIVHQLEEKKWLDFVDQHPQGNIFHTPEMFRAFSNAAGYDPTLWAAIDEQENPLALFLPVRITVMSRLFGAFGRVAIAYGSILAIPSPRGKQALSELLHAYNRMARGEVLFTELRNLLDIQAYQPILHQCGFLYQDHLNFLAHLNGSLDDIWKRLVPAARRNIHKAQASGIVVSLATHAEEIATTYSILRQHYHRIQTPLPPLSLFQAVFENLSPLNKVKVLIARHENIPIGVLYLLIYKNTALYWYTATLSEYRSYRPADLLMWSALQLSQELGCHTFDFGGAGKPDEIYGVRDFKAKFGGVLVNFGRNTCIHSPLRYHISQTAYSLKKTIEKIIF